jgi:hypothetical protein
MSRYPVREVVRRVFPRAGFAAPKTTALNLYHAQRSPVVPSINSG